MKRAVLLLSLLVTVPASADPIFATVSNRCEYEERKKNIVETCTAGVPVIVPLTERA